MLHCSHCVAVCSWCYLSHVIVCDVTLFTLCGCVLLVLSVPCDVTLFHCVAVCSWCYLFHVMLHCSHCMAVCSWCCMSHVSGICAVFHIVTMYSVQLADKLTAVFLCPSLSTIDGKPAAHLKQSVDRCRSKFLPAVCSIVVIVLSLKVALVGMCAYNTHYKYCFNGSLAMTLY